MLKKSTLLVLVALLLWALASSTEAAIERVPARLNVLEIHGGYALPIGSYTNVGGFYFEDSDRLPVELDANKVYNPSFYLGLNYGQLRNNHVFFGIGFRWTHISTEDEFEVEPGLYQMIVPETPNFNQYDIDFNLNYLASNPQHSKISPYVGIGFHAGVTSATLSGYESTNDVTLALGLNFGADLTVWKAADSRSLVTISSVNEWLFAASDTRPKYLNLGAAVKYYFRP